MYTEEYYTPPPTPNTTPTSTPRYGPSSEEIIKTTKRIIELATQDLAVKQFEQLKTHNYGKKTFSI